MACDCTRVGCAQNYVAYIAPAGSPGTPIGEVPQWTEIQWSRKKCGTSEARIVSAPDNPDSCCDLIGAVDGGVYPWRHELVIVRETTDCSQRVWNGPIDLVGGDFAHAVDPSAWLAYYPLLNGIDAMGDDPTTTAFMIIEQALAAGGNAGGLNPSMILAPSTETHDLEIDEEACEKARDALNRLCSEGLIEWWYEDGQIKIAPDGYVGENIGIIEDEHLASVPTIEIDGTDGPPVSEGGFANEVLCPDDEEPEILVKLDDLRLDEDTPLCLDTMNPTDTITMRLGDACQTINQEVRVCDVRVSVTVGEDGITENVTAAFEVA